MEMGELRALLETLEIPVDLFSVLGVWPGSNGCLEVHLSPRAFWNVVKRIGGEVRSTERSDLLFPYCHRITLEGVEFFTYSVEPVLAPGTLTPGYALRLT